MVVKNDGHAVLSSVRVQAIISGEPMTTIVYLEPDIAGLFFFADVEAHGFHRQDWFLEITHSYVAFLRRNPFQ